MITLNKHQKIKMSSMFSDNLALRQNANDLFDYIESLPEKEIIFDFECVTSMSRSFAHQYALRKNQCTKEITEVGKSIEVIRMFEFVKKQREKKPLIEISNIRVLAI